jgi:hypothetical protein
LFHEETVLLNNPHVSFYIRPIDDALVVLSNADGNYASFVATMNGFSPKGNCLEWEAEPHGLTVNFLDLTVTLLPSSTFGTSTFQKPMDLYLYQPLSYVQPSSILYGLIFGTLYQYYWQNMDCPPFEHFSWLFFQRLQAHGHIAALLAPLFLKSATNVDNST